MSFIRLESLQLQWICNKLDLCNEINFISFYTKQIVIDNIYRNNKKEKNIIVKLLDKFSNKRFEHDHVH